LAEIEYTKNLQSPAQFQRGDSLTVRGTTVPEMLAALYEASKEESLAEFFSVKEVVVEDVTDEAKPPSDIEALENLKNVLGATPVEEPASDNLRAVAAKKSGKTYAELEGISKTEAQRLIKEGSKK
jgi:hypothetical protein